MIKTKLIIFPATLVITLLFFFYIIKPEWNIYSANKIKLVEKEKEINRLRQNKDKFNEILKVYNGIGFQDKKLIKNAIPIGFSQENFLHDLNFIMLETGSRLKEVNFSEVKFRDEKDKILPTMDVSVGLVGNYFQTKRVLYMIENMNRLTRVNSYSMNIQKKEEFSSLDTNIELSVFYKESLRNLVPTSSDKYFSSLLLNGLNSELLNNYKNYREKVTEFDFNWDGEVGKENLFEIKDFIENPVIGQENFQEEMGEIN